MFLGAFIGARMEEDSDVNKSIKIALGALAGFMVGTMLKLSVSLYIIYIIFQTNQVLLFHPFDTTNEKQFWFCWVCICLPQCVRFDHMSSILVNIDYILRIFSELLPYISIFDNM